MRIGLPVPPFDYESLTSSFGFRVPPQFVTLLDALCEDCGSAQAAYDRACGSLGWLLAGDGERYQQTPPELFPIATTGVDGCHFGYVIHAPELATSDYPIAGLEPMDRVGAYLLGTSTFKAVETLLSTRILYEKRPFSHEWWPEVSTRLSRLGIEPALAKAIRHDCERKPVVPTVPDGWKHIPSSDGIGALAPATQFHAAPLHPMEEQPDVGSVLDVASRHAADHFPATALWLLRECYWRTWTEQGNDTIALCRAIIDSYHSLGRPSLAAVVTRRIARIGKWH